MEYRRLGNSGLLVSELCLGTMIFGEDSQRSASPETSTRMIHRFLDAGGNHIDTANVYAKGRSEEIVGEAIKGKRDQVVLATKVRFGMGDGPNDAGLSRYAITRSVEASLRRLQVDAIDLLYMHAWDPLTPIEEALETFDDLVRAGKVAYIGVSNFKAWQMMKALGLSDSNGWARFVAAQYQYSLVMRDIEREFTDLCVAEGVGLTPWGPLGGGFLSGKYRRGQRPTDPSAGRVAVAPDFWPESWERRASERTWGIVEAVEAIAAAHQVPPSQVALAWLLRQPAVASVIVGARTVEQLEDNLGATTLTLSAEELARLSELSALPDAYPYDYLRDFAQR